MAGSYVENSPEGLMDADPRFLDQFDLVIATQVGGAGGQKSVRMDGDGAGG